MSHRAKRLEELLAEPALVLDRPLAVVSSVDRIDPPTEEAVVAALDGLADDCPATDGLEDLLAHLFGAAGFVGNRTDYFDPANSLIHRVIEHRRGIPLSLAAVVAEVGRRRGFDVRPIGFPGHVLLGAGPEPTRWYDPFAAGAGLDVDACRRMFAALHPNGVFDRAMLAPMDSRSVVVRTLNNLRVAYANRGMAADLVPVLELRANLSSATVADRLELARLLAGLGRVEAAAAEFERLAELDPERAVDHRSRARGLRARLN